MDLKVQGLLLTLIVSTVLLLQTTGQTTDKYTDEKRPYEFGFVIEGQQHRHEKKDESGIITGEFGFVTADGIYHVTVYATDENGDFKIVSMKNVRIAPSPFGNPGTSFNTPRVDVGRSLGQITSTQPPPPLRTTSYKTSPAKPPVYQQSSTPATILTSTRKVFKLHNGCSNCLIPTTTTTTQAPPTPFLSRTNSQFSPKSTSSGLNFPPTNGPFFDRTPGASPPPVPSSGSVAGRNFGTVDSGPQDDNQSFRSKGSVSREQGTSNVKPPSELQPPFSSNQQPSLPKNSGFPSQFTQPPTKSYLGPSSSFSTPSGEPIQNAFGKPPSNIPTSVSAPVPGQIPIQSTQNSFGKPPSNVPTSISTPVPGQTPFQPTQNSFGKPPSNIPTSVSTPFSGQIPLQPTQNLFGKPPNNIPTSISTPVPGQTPFQPTQNSFGKPPNNIPTSVSTPVFRETPFQQTARPEFPSDNFGPQFRDVIKTNSPPPQISTNSITDDFPTRKANVPNGPQSETPNYNIPSTTLPQVPKYDIRGGFSPSTGDNSSPRTPGDLVVKVPPSNARTPSPIGIVRDGLPPGVSMSDVMNLLYIFNYTVGFHGHHESGYRNGDKEGGYFVNGRDGASRRVNYIANEFGYQPKVTLVDLGLNSPDTPKEETEKDFGLKGYEFKWFPS